MFISTSANIRDIIYNSDINTGYDGDVHIRHAQINSLSCAMENDWVGRLELLYLIIHPHMFY